jgi:hypothetical protein
MDPISQSDFDGTVALMTESFTPAPRTAPNPLVDLVGLTDGEVRSMGTDIAALMESDPVDTDAIRRLIADWALTVRIRNHPEFATNAAAFGEAMAREGLAPASP